jgi:hypothetical protein
MAKASLCHLERQVGFDPRGALLLSATIQVASLLPCGGLRAQLSSRAQLTSPLRVFHLMPLLPPLCSPAGVTPS